MANLQLGLIIHARPYVAYLAHWNPTVAWAFPDRSPPWQAKVEGLREELNCLPQESLAALLECIVEQTEDFTDSAYTSHEHREGILQLCHLARQELRQLCAHWAYAVSVGTTLVALTERRGLVTVPSDCDRVIQNRLAPERCLWITKTFCSYFAFNIRKAKM